MATLTKGTYANVESIANGVLIANGYNLAQRCGILANIEKESGFNPRALNTSEGAYGLCQWRSGRRSQLHARYGSSPSAQNQIRYILDEFVGAEKSAYNKIKDIPNTREGAALAGYNFARYYERCHQSHYDIRRLRAIDYWNHYNNGSNAGLTPASNLTYTPSSSDNSPATNVPSYTQLSSYTVDPYAKYMAMNLTNVESAGFDFGYLINLSHGGEFKFYIPEFSESAGANWGSVDIPGRSVTIKHYQSTNSRVISISLDLYAGVGLYTTEGNTTDVVGKLHKDMYFLKSLEYPDYSQAITLPPATVQLILGSAFSMKGVVSGVRIDHMKPLDSQNRAMYIRASFTVTEIADDPPGQSDIRNRTSSVINTRNPGTLISL